jgi:hypothetical protein
VRKIFLGIVFLALCPLLVAQQTLNNDAVIKLAKAGLSEDLIVSTINSQAGTYDTSADGIIALKTAGVTDKVVAAVVAKANVPTTTAVPATAAPAPSAPDPDDPASPHDPGVYLLTTDHSGQRKMVFVERAGAGNAKTAGVLAHAFTYGIVKAKLKADLPGPRAAIRASEARPTFYMFFPPMNGQSGLGGTDTITSPSQFSLLSLEDKKDHRETAIEKIGFASASVGNDEKRSFLFTSDRIRANVYKIVVNSNLKAGEYAFIASTRVAGTASGASVVIYDFGVDLK